MAKKKDFTFEDSDEALVPKTSVASKFPIDNTGAGKGMTEYQEIPVTRLHPFSRKGSFDFSRHGNELSSRFVETVKEYGIVEAVIVRKSPTQRDFFEIISGESRWTHAKEAGLDSVPCRVMTLDDDKAYRLFVILNLMRRELTPSDKINAWYSYFIEQKDKNLTNAQLEAMLKEDSSQAYAVAGKNSEQISLRKLLMYVKMHSLTQDWLARLDKGEVSIRTAYRVSFFPENIQTQLLEYKLTEAKLKYLYDHYLGKAKVEDWTDDTLSNAFERASGNEETVEQEKPKLNKTERKFVKAFRSATSQMANTLRTIIPPDDYDDFESIIEKAVRLYYERRYET